MPSFGWDATTTAPCFEVKGLAATAPSFQDDAATLPLFGWDAITRMPCFKGLAGMMPSFEDQAATTPSFQDEATMMPLFGWDAITSMMPSFEDVAAMMPLFEDHQAATMPSFQNDAATMPSFQDEVATMPSYEDGSATTTSFDCNARITTTSTIKRFKRHNPRVGKTKRVRGGIGSKRLFQRKSPPGPNQAFAGLTQASVGSGVPCITPLPTTD
jgi:hypothetical protein